MTCSKCGGELRHYDSRKRYLLTKGRTKKLVYVERGRCRVCGAVRTIYTDDIWPRVHYEPEVIRGVLEGLISPDILGYEDYPCEMTMTRWFAKFA